MSSFTDGRDWRIPSWEADIVSCALMRHGFSMRTTFIALVLFFTFAVAGCERSPKTYASSCSKPLSNWKTEKDGRAHLRATLPVMIGSDGAVIWGRNVVSGARLRALMHDAGNLNPAPQIVLDVSPSAPCEKVVLVRAIMDKAPMCKDPYRLCSEGWNWKEWPDVGGP